MKKSLSILTGLGIIAVGVWVYQTRTPVVLPPAATDATPAPDAGAPVQGETTANTQASPAPTAAVAPASEFQKILSQLKGPDQRKLIILDEILKSQNDNDPRLDTEFKTLSPALKQAFTQYYKSIPDERRNERGTVVFLYARAMTDPQDTAFLGSVLMEKPCLSLENCSKPSSGGGHEHAHLDGIAETTANYPQLTAIRQALEAYNRARGESPPNMALANAIIERYRQAVNSDNPRVAEEARLVLKYLRQ